MLRVDTARIVTGVTHYNASYVIKVYTHLAGVHHAVQSYTTAALSGLSY
jgi:hypothetical protein